jgi:hypothetical protein
MNRQDRHLTEQEIDRFCGQQMPPAELLLADQHLAECDACYARLSQVKNLGEKLIGASKAFSLPADVRHLTYEELAAVVDNQLSDIDREIAESHLETCSHCVAELDELRGLASELNSLPAKATEISRKPSVRERFLALWQTPAFQLPVLIGLAAACLALFAILFLIPLRRENAELRSKIADLEQSNQTLKEQAATVETLQNEVAALRQENNQLRGIAPNGPASGVELLDGSNRITLDQQGNLAGLQTTSRNEQLVKEALLNGRVKVTTSFAGGSATSGTLMGKSDNPSFRLVSPVNRVIESDRPTFRWRGLDGLATFNVSIFDESLNKVLESESLIKNQWTATPALKRGQTYIWQVRANVNNQEIIAPAPGQPRAKFKVLEQSKIDEIENAKRMATPSHLVMGILYADAGLLENAEREFNALLKANPQSPVARRLLQSVRAAKR